MGWSLVQIKDSTDVENVAAMISSNGYSHTFTGATRQTSSSPWLWEDGTAANAFDFWYSGYPNTDSYHCQYFEKSNKKVFDYPCSSCPDQTIMCQRKFGGTILIFIQSKVEYKISSIVAVVNNNS